MSAKCCQFRLGLNVLINHMNQQTQPPRHTTEQTDGLVQDCSKPSNMHID